MYQPSMKYLKQAIKMLKKAKPHVEHSDSELYLEICEIIDMTEEHIKQMDILR